MLSLTLHPITPVHAANTDSAAWAAPLSEVQCAVTRQLAPHQLGSIQHGSVQHSASEVSLRQAMSSVCVCVLWDT